MPKINEYVELLKEQKIEEAYEGFKECYQKTKDELALYYLTMIDVNYHFDKTDLGYILNNFDILFRSKNSKIRAGIYDTYLSLLLDLDDMEKCFFVSEKARNDGIDSYIVNLAYAKSLVSYKQVYNKEVITLLQEAIDNAPTDNIKEVTEVFLCDLYCKRKEYEEAEKLINKTYFSQIKDITNYLNLMLATYKNPESDNSLEIEKAMNSNYKYESLMFLSDFYYDRREYEKTLSYIEELLILTNNESFLQIRKVICLVDLDRDDDALTYLATLDQENYDVLMYTAKILVYKKNRKKLDESKKYLLKALDIDATYEVYKYLFKVCDETLDFKTFALVIDRFEKDNPNHPLLVSGKMKYYNRFTNFDEAYKISKKIGKLKYHESIIFETSYCEPNPVLTYKKLQKLIKNEDYEFTNVRANYYGEYGLKINKTVCDKFIKDYDDFNANCTDSLIAKMYLDREDIPNALKVINRGVERFKKDEDNCTCIMGYYIYIMMNGIGIKKDVNKAYEVALQTINDNYEVVSESLGNAYAECAIMLNKDLNPVYDFLIRTRERRYSLGRYFMIIKVGKLLNKDVSYYEKMYQKSFKYDTKLERAYYKNNPTTFMMNNF